MKREFLEVDHATKEAVVAAAKKHGMPTKTFTCLVMDHVLSLLRAKTFKIVQPTIITKPQQS